MLAEKWFEAPWHVERLGDDIMIYAEDKDDKGRPICEVVKRDSYDLIYGNDNANLIACAPELYNQLSIANDNLALVHSDKREANECAFDLGSCSCGLAANWRHNEAVLTKARGEKV
jgi:hypothetical protein